MFTKALQKLYISLLSPWIPFVSRIPEKWRLRLITACFMTDLLLFGIVRYVLRRESYFYNTTLGIMLMIVIAILSLDKALKEVRWHRSIRIVWFGMCIAFTVSDVLVPKKITGLGVILALVFTGVFFVWQNHSRRDLLWESAKKAIRITFVIMTIVCFCFRPIYEGGRYAGIFTNPNTFGLYLIIIAAVYMSDLDWEVATGRYWYKAIPTYIGLGLTFFYLALTQGRTAVVTVGVIVVMWLAFKIHRAVVTHRWRSFLKNVMMVLIFSALVYPVSRMAITYLPWVIGHPIIFDGESLYLSDGSKIGDLGETVIAEPDLNMSSLIDGYMPAAEITDVGDTYQPASAEIYQPAPGERYDPTTDAPEKPLVAQSMMERFWYVLEHTSGLNALTSGRIEIYKGYYKQLNYKGHESVALTINGSTRAHAHNNWLQFGYTYGYFGMIFYGIMTILVFFYSIRYYKKRSRKNASYAFFIPAVCVGVIVATVTECLFLPFEVFPAFMFWFVCGELFEKEVIPNRFKRSLAQ